MPPPVFASTPHALLNRLRSEHANVVALLTAIQRDLEGGSIAAARSRAGDLSILLRDHHGLEREVFFPPLIERLDALPSSALSQAVRASQLMQGPVEALISGFARRLTPDSAQALAAHLRDWKGISSALTDRLHTEETTLFRLYEQHLPPRGQPPTTSKVA